ncbi:MAG: 1-acyl-sn-glycerol-3-phosphate acyltransferase [Vicinamibacterales bacterium]
MARVANTLAAPEQSPEMDALAQSILARDDLARYLRNGDAQTREDLRDRIRQYLEELRTTQRYPIYRQLKHPLYPILHKIDRRGEHVDIPRTWTTKGRVVYVSNHKSHTDYLVEPLVLDDNHIRPPVIAAGINLFGGPLGLLHRHVTGAIPIRRNTKDPAYLATLKAYVAEVLRRHDLFFYIEGGRSYSGELKSPKTGLVHACLQAQHQETVIIPVAVAYDLVLEDRILARQGVKRKQRPFAVELAEMVATAVGYQSRAIVTFGDAIPLAGHDPQSRRDVLELAHTIRERIGRLHKVLPTALVARAMRPSMPRGELVDRVADMHAELQQRGANVSTARPKQLAEEGITLLALRGVIVEERDRLRVRDRRVLRYYARTLDHLFKDPRTDDRPH